MLQTEYSCGICLHGIDAHGRYHSFCYGSGEPCDVARLASWFRTNHLGRPLWTNLNCLIDFVTGAAIWHQWSIHSDFVLTELVLMADGIALSFFLEDLTNWLIPSRRLGDCHESPQTMTEQ